MKWPLLAPAALALVAISGCGHMDLTPEGEGNPDRVLTGTIEFRDPVQLPADTIAVVRVLDAKREGETPPTAVLGEPSANPVRSQIQPLVLGEQVIRGPGQPPIPFRIEYTALDDQLRRGLNVEARISYGGKIQFYNVLSYAVTLGSAGDSHTVWVNRVDR